MTDYHIQSLTLALRRLADTGVLPAVVRQLDGEIDAINRELRDTVLAEIPAFSESKNPDILPELDAHGRAHTQEVVRLLRSGRIGEFEFVRAHARRRAEQRFPLEATLHAYRCGHKVFSRRLRAAALAAQASASSAQQSVAVIVDFAMEYTDAISTIAAGAYSAHTRVLAAVAGDRRAQLLTILLEGYDEADGRVTQILRDAGYLDQRQSFCVVLARSVDPSEMLNPDRARRMAEFIDSALGKSPWRRHVDLRDDKVTVVLSHAARLSGWTAPQTSLARKVTAALATVGNAALIGVSNDAPSTSHIPNAHREAALALEIADVTRRVLQFSEIPMRRLMLYLAGEEARRALPSWTPALGRGDAEANGALVATLHAYADADMNVLKAAARLSVHPNTVYARLQRVQDLTGLNARRYHALSELLMVADCVNPAMNTNRGSGG